MLSLFLCFAFNNFVIYKLIKHELLQYKNHLGKQRIYPI